MDSRADPVENVESALAKGLAGLTFTEHFDTHPDEWDGCVYDDEAYSHTIESLRERFGDRIFIGKGIEVCYQPARMDFIMDFLKSHAFDLVILSVHFFGEKPLHTRSAWDDVSVEEGARIYLEHVTRAVRHCAEIHSTHGRVFDVLGHLDLVKRYTWKWFGQSEVHRFDGLTDAIIAACIDADMIPEINTSSLRRGLDETMPSLDVVKCYAEKGGTMMSLGSDAHVPRDVGAGFDVAVQMLRDAGIHHTARFQRRERTAIPLE